jgi:hypothetical protein
MVRDLDLLDLNSVRPELSDELIGDGATSPNNV